MNLCFYTVLLRLTDVSESGKHTLSFIQSCLDVLLCPVFLTDKAALKAEVLSKVKKLTIYFNWCWRCCVTVSPEFEGADVETFLSVLVRQHISIDTLSFSYLKLLLLTVVEN